MCALPGDLPDLDGTGYDQDSLDELLRQVQVLDPGRDTDPEEPPSEPVTQLGDLVVLGGGWTMRRGPARHRPPGCLVARRVGSSAGTAPS